MNPQLHNLDHNKDSDQGLLHWELIRIGLVVLTILIGIVVCFPAALVISWMIKGFPDPVSSATGLGVFAITFYVYLRMYVIIYQHYQVRPKNNKNQSTE